MWIPLGGGYICLDRIMVLHRLAKPGPSGHVGSIPARGVLNLFNAFNRGLIAMIYKERHGYT